MISIAKNDDLRAAWFGKVSPNWKLARAKNAFRVVSKKVGERSPEFDLLSLTLRGIIARDIESGKGKFPESFDTYQEVNKSDIVFCLFDVDETPRTVGLSHFDGMITGAYTVVRCTERAEPRYVTYFYLSIDERKGLRPFYTGLRKVVRTETFLNAAFPLPDLPTQRAIADFLDRETARIDLLIEKKQRLVELLGERKTTQLENLLFGSNFELRKLRRESQVISKGTTPSTIGAEMVSDGIRFLKAENVTWGGVNTYPENFISKETHRALRRSILYDGDVLVVIAGATTGKTAVMPASLAPANTNQAVSFVRLRNLQYAKIVCAALSCPCVQRDILLTSVQSAQPNLSMHDLGNLMVPFPQEEQILKVLGQVNLINKTAINLISATESSINRLKEYRSALITAAVTGQIDVTEYAKSGTTDRRLDAIQEEMGA